MRKILRKQTDAEALARKKAKALRKHLRIPLRKAYRRCVRIEEAFDGANVRIDVYRLDVVVASVKVLPVGDHYVVVRINSSHCLRSHCPIEGLEE